MVSVRTQTEEAMKANERICPIALVFCLIAALALFGSSPAEAKKKDKPPPPPRWAVTIPDCVPGGFSLCGDIGKTYYEDSADEDGLGIRVSSGQEQGETHSRFGFGVYKCLEGERCHTDCQGPDCVDQPPPVYLQGIDVDVILPIDWEEIPCQFPGECGDYSPPACMECFLNGPHPYWVTGSPEEDYRLFSFELKVFNYDYESSPHPFEGWAYLNIEAYNTDDALIPPDEDNHNIFGDNWEDPTNVTITADPGSDSWTLDVTVTEPMLFREWYTGCARDPNPKGKCPTEYKFPLDASSSNYPHAFQVTWTKIPSEE